MRKFPTLATRVYSTLSVGHQRVTLAACGTDDLPEGECKCENCFFWGQTDDESAGCTIRDIHRSLVGECRREKRDDEENVIFCEIEL